MSSCSPVTCTILFFSLGRRNKASLHEDDRSESSDSSDYASIDARSILSSSTRRQHERRLRKQRQQKHQQKQSLRQRMRQPDDLNSTLTGRAESRGGSAALSRSGEDIPGGRAVAPEAKIVAPSTSGDFSSFCRRRGKLSTGGSAPSLSTFSYRSSYLSTPSSTDFDSDTSDRSAEFRSSSDASSSKSSFDSDGSTGGSDSESDSDNDSQSDTIHGESTAGGTSASHPSSSSCTRTSRSSSTGSRSRSVASNCWSDGVFESTTDSTPPIRARRARVAVTAAAAAPATNNLPAIPLPIPAFAANSNRRRVTPQTVPAEKVAAGESARDGGRLEMDPGAMAISLLKRGSSRTRQKIRSVSPHRTRHDQARTTNSEAGRHGMDRRDVVHDRDQDQAPHGKGVPFDGVVQDGSEETKMPLGPDFVYGHELSEQVSSSSSESSSLYDGFDSETERTATREREDDIGGGKRRVNDGGKCVDGSREADISLLENDSIPTAELEEVAVAPAGKGESLGERADVYETGVSAEEELRSFGIAERARRKKDGKGKGVGRVLKAAAAAIAGRLEANKKRNKSLRGSVDDSVVVGRGEVGDTGDSDGLSLPPYRSHSTSKGTLHAPDQRENQHPSSVWKPPRRLWRGRGNGGLRESKLRDRKEKEVSMFGTPSVHVV